MSKLFKKLLFFLSVVSACICFCIMVYTFAKYITSANQIASIPIARWNIKVNDVSIKNNSTLSSVISPVFPGNSHIASGVIAPTAEGYFDLVFDFSDTDVSFIYDINIKPNKDSSVTDLVVSGYSVDNEERLDFDSNTGISDTIYYNSGIDSRTIRVYILWDDSSNASMNNIADAAATFESSNEALLDVSISFTQTTSTI